MIMRLISTIKYLKLKQIFFRLYYIFRKRLRYLTMYKYPLSTIAYGNKLSLTQSIVSETMYKEKEFTFLNISRIFFNEIDWNFFEHGKLWNYNLTYFEYLNQVEMPQTVGLELINDYIEQGGAIKDGVEPFPISLRGINWIKFLSKHQIQDQVINDSLYAQYLILLDNLEYHLMGNHLLENAFSLLFGAYYYKDDKLYKKAKKILLKELEEQILQDGAHFELSPMYHQIMLYRVLDCINLVQNNDWKKQELLTSLIAKAETMLGWLDIITYKNGNIPLLNDSANHIAPSTEEINQYAKLLNVKMHKLVLSDCGYRKIEKKKYEMIVDVGNIGPDYIPGHAHSDTFNFELYIDSQPFLVDSGVSTYETNKRRILERATSAHNTVELGGLDQSEVWSSFRVAKRAYVVDKEEKKDYIRAIHDGYKQRLNALHQREFLFEDKNIKIIDTIISEKECYAISRLHFYPNIEPQVIDDNLYVNDVWIKIKDASLKIKEYNYAPEFNKLLKAKMLEISFMNKLEIEIIL